MVEFVLEVDVPVCGDTFLGTKLQHISFSLLLSLVFTRHTKDNKTMVPVVPLFSTQYYMGATDSF